MLKEKRDAFRKTNPCDEKVKTKLCGKSTNCTYDDKEGNFQCRCKAGFTVIGSYNPETSRDKTFIQKCDDIDECKLEPSPCPKSSTNCHNEYGGYHCVCKDGFKIKNGSSDPKDGCVSLCEPNPCIHGKCVLVDKVGIACNCSYGYSGIYCSTAVKITENTSEPNKGAAIVGGVLGAILVVMLIAGFFIYKRMKKTQNYDEKYAVNAQKSFPSEVNRLRREQPSSEIEEGLELRNRGTMIPRAKRSTESGEDRRAQPETGMSSLKQDRPSRAETRGSRVYYSNSGYDEEEKTGI